MEKLLKWIKEKNIHFYIRIILLSALPIATAMELSEESMFNWYWKDAMNIILEFLSRPYLVGLYLFTLYQSFKISKKEIE